MSKKIPESLIDPKKAVRKRSQQEERREHQLQEALDAMDPFSWTIMWLCLPDRRQRLKRQLNRLRIFAASKT